jgi:acid phosphatase (class A)
MGRERDGLARTGGPLAAAALLLLGAPSAWPQAATPPSAPLPQALPGGDHVPTAAISPKGGYLDPASLPDPVLILPPAPAPGSSLDKADRAVFESTRRLKDGPRWRLAALDAVDYFGPYACALGAPLTPATTPLTLAMLRRAGVDASRLTNIAKDHYRRPRPFVGADQPICVEDQRAALTKSASYPSGHATFGWTAALILAEAAPDRAGAILARGRAFAESRVVCGVHDVSDVEMGMVLGSVLVSALHTRPAFAADLAAAKAELAAVRAAPAAPPPGESCAADLAAEAHTPWANPVAAK